LDLINDGQVEIRLLEEHTKPISPENSLGRISRMDAINNKGVAEASLRNKKSKLSKLQVALGQIDKPGFGNCSVCKCIIQEGRLMYMPEVTRCVNCASR
jgi:DnaK suppressor protein